MRLDPEDRRKQMLDAATLIAVNSHYTTVTREAIASAVGCTKPLITHYFGSMENLRRNILIRAIESENFTILQQAIINKDEALRHVARDILSAAVEAIEI